MKIVTYNIRFGLGLDQLNALDRIATEIDGADIIALQEVERFWHRSCMADQPEILGELLKGFYWTFCPAFDVDASILKEDGSVLNRRRQHGPMLLSRWPILSARSLILPQLAATDMISMATGALECVIKTPLGCVRVYSLHLSALSPRERLLQLDTFLQMNKTIEKCGSVIMTGNPVDQIEAQHISNLDWNNGEPPLPKPSSTIVMGDFNSIEGSKEYIRMVGEADPINGYGIHPGCFVDSWNVTQVRSGGTHSWWPDPPERSPGYPLRLDYCFISTDLAKKVNHCWIGTQSCGSDHKPYWVEFTQEDIV